MKNDDAPKVLTLNQVRNSELVWVEDRDWMILQGYPYRAELEWRFITWLGGKKRTHENQMEHSFNINEYKVNWRCWDKKPSPTLMRNTPWKK